MTTTEEWMERMRHMAEIATNLVKTQMDRGPDFDVPPKIALLVLYTIVRRQIIENFERGGINRRDVAMTKEMLRLLEGSHAEVIEYDVDGRQTTTRRRLH